MRKPNHPVALTALSVDRATSNEEIATSHPWMRWKLLALTPEEPLRARVMIELASPSPDAPGVAAARR